MSATGGSHARAGEQPILLAAPLVAASVARLSFRRTGASVRIGTSEPCSHTAVCPGPMTGRLAVGRLAIESGGQESVRHEYVATN